MKLSLIGSVLNSHPAWLTYIKATIRDILRPWYIIAVHAITRAASGFDWALADLGTLFRGRCEYR